MLGRRASAIIFSITCAASLALAHGALIGYKTYANVDEAYASAIGSRLVDGFKLYDGAVSQRGPLMYESFALFARVCGWDNIVALRVVALCLALAQVLLVYLAGRALLNRTAAVVATAITTYALAFGFPALDGVAINGETLQAPFVIVATALGAIAMRRRPGSRERTRDLAVSGILWGAAVAIKPQILPQIVPISIWLALDARRRGTHALVRDAAVALGSVLVVPLFFVAFAAANGTLSSLVYYTITYNFAVHLGGSAVPWLSLVYTRLHEEPLFFIATTLLFARAFPFVRRRVASFESSKSIWSLGRGFGTRAYLGVHFVIAFAVAIAAQRFFPHYWIVALPSFAWLAGASLSPFFLAERHRTIARAMLAGFMLLTLGASALECVIRERFDGRVAHDRTVQDVGAYIASTTPNDARIFVWGFSPWIYGYSHRKPAGRFVFSTYVTGFIPWFWDSLDAEKARAVPGSMQALIDDLDREKPEIIVDAGSVMMARPMRAYEMPAVLLHSKYCFEARIGAYDIYRRRPEDGSCDSYVFPVPHWAIDAWGHPLPVPVAPVVDTKVTRALPPSAYYDLVTFPGIHIPADGARAVAHREGTHLWAEEIDPADPLPASHPERTPPLALPVP